MSEYDTFLIVEAAYLNDLDGLNDQLFFRVNPNDFCAPQYEMGGALYNAPGEYVGFSPLSVAVKRGADLTFTRLLNHPAVNLNFFSPSLGTAAMQAVLSDRLGFLQRIIDKPSFVASAGMPALKMSAFFAVDQANPFLNDVEIDKPATASRLALAMGRMDMVEALALAPAEMDID